jgi:hypothetical protein
MSVAIADAIEVIHQSPANSFERGIHASFKKITDQWGVKFYDSKYIRDETYDLQKMAHAIDCAPALGEKFEVNTPRTGTIYGYVTECVVRMGSDKDENDMYARSEEMKDLPEYVELIESLKSIMDVDDMHGGNVGYLANGRMVAIDFSLCSYWTKIRLSAGAASTPGADRRLSGLRPA